MNGPGPERGPARAGVRGERVVRKLNRAARGSAPITGTGAAVVVKIGGRALEGAHAPAELAAELARPGGVVLVHGGGIEVSAWCARMGIAPAFADGLRVTDAQTLEVVTAVLAGLANSRLVAQLRARGVDAVGLSALDGGLTTLDPHPDAARLGAVGRVRGVDPSLLDTLLAQGRVPVLASIGAIAGELVNLNADDFAAALAPALGARDLVLLSDAPGLLLDGAVVPWLPPEALARTLARPEVRDGMRPKLVAARAALEGGVERVHIASWTGPGTLTRLLAGEGAGTTLIAAAPQAAHG